MSIKFPRTTFYLFLIIYITNLSILVSLQPNDGFHSSNDINHKSIDGMRNGNKIKVDKHSDSSHSSSTDASDHVLSLIESRMKPFKSADIATKGIQYGAAPVGPTLTPTSMMPVTSTPTSPTSRPSFQPTSPTVYPTGEKRKWYQLSGLGRFTPRYAHSSVIDENNKIYLIGGVTGSGSALLPTIVNDIWTFQDHTAVAFLQLPYTGHSLTARMWHTSIYNPNSTSILVFGGYNGTSELNDLWQMNINSKTSNTWSHVKSTTPIRMQPSGRDSHSAVFNSVPTSQTMYIMGGYTSSNISSETWSYRMPSKSWTLLSTDKLCRRYGHSSQLIGQYIYTIGGFDGTKTLNDVIQFDTTTNKWKRIAIAANSEKFPSRAYHSSVIDPTSGFIYITGGIAVNIYNKTSVYSDVWVFKPSSQSWEEIVVISPITMQGPNPFPARYSHTTLLNPSTGETYTMAGSGSASGFDTPSVTALLGDVWSLEIFSTPSVQPSSARPIVSYEPSSVPFTLPLYTAIPTAISSLPPILTPTIRPSKVPHMKPSKTPFLSNQPTISNGPTSTPSSRIPTSIPSIIPSNLPTVKPTLKPTSPTLIPSSIAPSYTQFPTYTNDQWLQLISPSRFYSRYMHASVFDITKDIIYVIGGYGFDITTGTSKYLNDIWSLNLLTNNVWTQLATTGASFTSRMWHSAVLDVKTHCIIVFGGYNGKTELNDLWSYNITSNQWKFLNTSTKPQARDSHTATIDSKNRKMYVVGGFFDFGAIYNELWVYNIDSNSWQLILTNQMVQRYAHTTILYNNLLYIIGGYDGSVLPSQIVIYNTITTRANVTMIPNGYSARVYHTSFIDITNGLIYSLAGLDLNSNQLYQNMWMFDINSHNASFNNPTSPQKSIGRFGHSGLFNYKSGAVYMIAGCNNPNAFGTPTEATAANMYNDIWTLEVFGKPSMIPTSRPTSPTSEPSFDPTIEPTSPTCVPSSDPTTIAPTYSIPSKTPTTSIPSSGPTSYPTFRPTSPTASPSRNPTSIPSTAGPTVFRYCSAAGPQSHTVSYEYFTVIQTFSNATLATLLLQPSLASFNDTINCILSGQFLIQPIQLFNIHVKSPTTVNPYYRVIYTIKYAYPRGANLAIINQYFIALSNKLVTSSQPNIITVRGNTTIGLSNFQQTYLYFCLFVDCKSVSEGVLYGSAVVDPNSNPSATQSPNVDSYSPTSFPSKIPSIIPTFPTIVPTFGPTSFPSFKPIKPSRLPSFAPTISPGAPIPSYYPSFEPSSLPTIEPSMEPSFIPTIPTVEPTYCPPATTKEYDPNLIKYRYASVKQTIINATAKTMMTPEVLAAYNHTIECILQGDYLIRPVELSYFSAVTNLISPSTDDYVPKVYSNVTTFSYYFKFAYNGSSSLFYPGLKAQFSKSISDMSFESTYKHYCLMYNNCTQTQLNVVFSDVTIGRYSVVSLMPALNSKSPSNRLPSKNTVSTSIPNFISVQPTIQSNSASSATSSFVNTPGFIGVILVIIVLCLAFASYFLYRYLYPKKVPKHGFDNDADDEGNDDDDMGQWIDTGKMYSGGADDSTAGENPRYSTVSESAFGDIRSSKVAFMLQAETGDLRETMATRESIVAKILSSVGFDARASLIRGSFAQQGAGRLSTATLTKEMNSARLAALERSNNANGGTNNTNGSNSNSIKPKPGGKNKNKKNYGGDVLDGGGDIMMSGMNPAAGLKRQQSQGNSPTNSNGNSPRQQQQSRSPQGQQDDYSEYNKMLEEQMMTQFQQMQRIPSSNLGSGGPNNSNPMSGGNPMASGNPMRSGGSTPRSLSPRTQQQQMSPQAVANMNHEDMEHMMSVMNEYNASQAQSPSQRNVTDTVVGRSGNVFLKKQISGGRGGGRK